MLTDVNEGEGRCATAFPVGEELAAGVLFGAAAGFVGGTFSLL